MRNQWFGPDTDAAFAAILERVPTPVGKACYICDRPIEENDIGLMLLNHCAELLGEEARTPVHRACLLDLVGTRVKWDMPHKEKEE